jgi:hypothetical protein
VKSESLSRCSVNGCVYFVLAICCVQNLSQAADRRDRLIYVLSQINAARGDDAMYVDEESPGGSDDENVRLFVTPFGW